MTTPVHNDYTYVDKTTGQTVDFAAKSDELMVRLSRGTTQESLNDVVENTRSLSVSQGYNLERGFAAVWVTPGSDRESAEDSLDSRPEVESTIPVLVDQYGASRYFLPDEFTVQFRDDVDTGRMEEILDELGARVITKQRTPGYYTLAVPEGQGLFEAIRASAERDEVLFAEPSEVSFNSALPVAPSDPDFNQLWGLENTGQTVNGVIGTAGADISATEAWDMVRGDREVIVAVIDTGADLDHDDLEDNILPRAAEDWDFADGADPSPEDEDGHGSHVSGTVAAVGNTIGVIGVAPDCRVMPLRVDLTTGMNQNRADAINYVAQRARNEPERRFVINCSWRMNGDHAGVRTAIQNAVRDNVVVVFAAGNDGLNTDISPQFPGVYPEVMAVAALDSDDVRATFSNVGTNVDVAAPGVNIFSTLPGGTHGFLDGTSMASPHVAGVAALVWSRNRGLTNEQVRRVVEHTCDNVDGVNPGVAGMLGRGRVNAARAVAAAVPLVTAFSLRADLTGDGRADIVGFGDAGVWVALNNGNGTFQPITKVIDNFAYDAGGWRVEKHPRFLADLTGDGRADIVGFGDAGVWVALNNGNGTFQPITKVIDNFAYDAGGWRVEKHPRFLADLTGDGRADIVGFGDAGVWVALNNGNGTFQPITKVIDNFAYDAGGWRVEKHPRFLADLTGDGRADIIGFGDAGVWVALNNGNGTFQPITKVIDNFAYDAGGWRVEKHPRFLADLTGDGRADIIGFGDAGVWVALNNGNGTFQPITKVIDNFAYDAGGWRVEKHPRFLADLTGDGRADIIGFGDAGVWVALNNGNGTFQPITKVIDNFAYDAGGWRVEKHPRFLADLTGDGRADIIGFGDAGVWVALNKGDGSVKPITKVIDNFAYSAGGWRVGRHPRLVPGPW